MTSKASLLAVSKNEHDQAAALKLPARFILPSPAAIPVSSVSIRHDHQVENDRRWKRWCPKQPEVRAIPSTTIVSSLIAYRVARRRQTGRDECSATSPAQCVTSAPSVIFPSRSDLQHHEGAFTIACAPLVDVEVSTAAVGAM